MPEGARFEAVAIVSSGTAGVGQQFLLGATDRELVLVPVGSFGLNAGTSSIAMPRHGVRVELARPHHLFTGMVKIFVEDSLAHEFSVARAWWRELRRL